MTDFTPSARLRATLVHAAISATVAACAAALVFWVWYPWPYSVLAGGTGLFFLITGVDVVVGPLITLTVFDTSKGWPVLRRDLAVVAALQLGALLYGLNVMFEARPVALAMEAERFRVVRAVDVALDELPIAVPQLRTLPLTGPVLLRAEPPTTADAQLEAIDRAFAGQDIGTRPKFWRTWDATADRLAMQASKPLNQLVRPDSPRRAELLAQVAQTGLSPEQVNFLPLVAHFADWVVLIDARNGKVIGFAPFDGYRVH